MVKVLEFAAMEIIMTTSKFFFFKKKAKENDKERKKNFDEWRKWVKSFVIIQVSARHKREFLVPLVDNLHSPLLICPAVKKCSIIHVVYYLFDLVVPKRRNQNLVVFECEIVRRFD